MDEAITMRVVAHSSVGHIVRQIADRQKIINDRKVMRWRLDAEKERNLPR